ncbi:THAP domain-containing protein 2-like [Sphaeramia orbicularis]|uniref:THAP domain-containing protein 2-like n=1 Tax=Sphaeramia orbicularis TaxID=375764 RepID=A0A673ARM1_9TELE|nr:THAP domain-containing protein 2-like isoform X2 [Sphaeramia orbicularis]XP_029994378.1 THAP domain-containing protein 2-like [Sphaeramia orbicularis]
MPESCAAWGCKNRRTVQSRSRGITFHKFPKDKKLRRQWEVALRRRGFSASRSSVLCSDHFRPEDFDRTGQTVRLRDRVRPTVFSFSTHLHRLLKNRTTETSRRAAEPPGPDRLRPTEPTEPTQNHDHSYALPSSPSDLKLRLTEALARVESLEKEVRNVKDRERRAKKVVHELLEDLKNIQPAPADGGKTPSPFT